MACSTEGATIRYTTDGTLPTEDSDVYVQPLQVSQSTSFHAQAFLDAMQESEVASIKVAKPPLLFPNEGIFDAPVSVPLQEGMTYFISQDGGPYKPYTSNDSLTIGRNTVLQAYVHQDGLIDSLPVTQKVRVRTTAPSFSVAGDGLGNKLVSIQGSSEDADIICTLKGRSFPYTGQFSVTEDTLIEAYEQRDGYERSYNRSLWVTVDKTPDPAITLTSGEDQEILLSCTDPGAVLWYQIAGEKAFTPANRIPVKVGEPLAVKAYAQADGKQRSATVSAFFPVAGSPELSVASGFYGQPISLEMKGSGIRYRINDGPFAEYDGKPVSLSSYARLDAYRSQDELVNSALVSRSYAVIKSFSIPEILPEEKEQPTVPLEETTRWNVGDIGPAGGIIFYDKGSYSDNWRYLEAAPSDEVGSFKWGQYGLYNSVGNVCVGSGVTNTAVLLSSDTNVENAATVCCSKRVESNSRVFDDWYLPSLDELVLLKASDAGGSLGSRYYWSSSEESPTLAWEYDTQTDTAAPYYKNATHAVRSIRSF